MSKLSRWGCRFTFGTALIAGCLLAEQNPLRGQIPSAQRLPMVVSAVAPPYPGIAKAARIEGSVELNVTTDGERVTQVDIIKPVPLLDQAARRGVATWVFAPHQPTSFHLTVAYNLRNLEEVAPGSCVTKDEPRITTHDLPGRVQVIGVMDRICEPEIRIVGKRRTVSALTGIMVCDCPGSAPLADIWVSVRRQPTDAEEKKGIGRYERTGVTGRDGRFRFDDAPPGDYAVTVSALTYSSGTYLVQLRADNHTRPELSIALIPYLAVMQYLKDHPRDRNWVGVDERIPTYPLEAWKANIEGVVMLRMTPGSVPSVVAGNPVLAVSAMDYAKNWMCSSPNSQPFDVRIVYKLVESDDVGGGPKVVMDLPRGVEITAKRAQPANKRLQPAASAVFSR